MLAAALALLAAAGPAPAVTGAELRAAIRRDLEAGRPLVAHVTVALCDNRNQGIVPLPEALGNGQDPGSNLYWGARYGVRTWFRRAPGWTHLEVDRPAQTRILARAAFSRVVRRDGKDVALYVVADAWDGAEIRGAVTTFLEMCAGRRGETVTVRAADAPANAAMVLACASEPFFRGPLAAAGAQPLLLTTGLMAPEAYTLDAAIRAWAGGGTAESVCLAAARAYDGHQHCGLSGARRLFRYAGE